MPYDTAHYAPALWARVRDDYLAGETSEVVCARHGMSRSQLFAQARAGGWRRSDLPAAAAPDDDVDADAPAPPTAELAAQALRRGAHAVGRGRLHEAQGWVALAARLRALAKDERDSHGWRAFLPTPPAAGPPTPPAEPGEPAPPPPAPGPGPVEVAEAVARLAREGAELDRRREAGEDVTRESRALEARVDALEARSLALAASSPPARVADVARGPDGPAGLPPPAGVSGAAMSAALGWEPASSACLPGAAPPAAGPPSRRPPSAPSPRWA